MMSDGNNNGNSDFPPVQENRSPQAAMERIRQRMVNGEAPWLTSQQAASYLGLTIRALYRRCARKQIPVHKFGRQLRFRRRELDELLEAGFQPVDSASTTAQQQDAHGSDEEVPNDAK